MRLILPALMSLALPAVAQDIQDLSEILPLICDGAEPAWSMTITEDGSLFDYGRTSDLDIAWETQAEGAQWPRALTLIGRGDTAIVILEAPTDDSYPIRILTQRGETPLLLTGTCVPS